MIAQRALSVQAELAGIECELARLAESDLSPARRQAAAETLLRKRAAIVAAGRAP